MAEEKGFYEIYDHDRLEPGEKAVFERKLYFREKDADLSWCVRMTADELKSLREGSVMQEKAIFKKLGAAMSEWQEQASNTMLLDRAIEYVETRPVEHTSNEWVPTEYGVECSNMVYSMTYRVWEDTSYNHSTKKQEIVGWDLYWSLHYNFPDHARGGGHIAGQDRKRFKDKEALDKYMIGRIAAYAHYFQDLSPPVPKDIAWKFSRNGLLLPGYTVEGQEPPLKEIQAQGEENADSGTDYSKLIRKNAKKDTTPKRGRAR
ncbi:hypothetical protein LJC60_06685 [Ruminococcaceae bacterium OttesenSCG-928-D13]|nr:hypothetical protein [Ruminococcaceae bacterium OttesenSCG-928-D13]